MIDENLKIWLLLKNGREHKISALCKKAKIRGKELIKRLNKLKRHLEYFDAENGVVRIKTEYHALKCDCELCVL